MTFAVAPRSAPCFFFLTAAVVALLPPSRGSAASADESFARETIFVTARKRIERLDAVPQPVAVISSEDLARRGITLSPDIAHIEPNLMWHSMLGLATPQIFLRGIGNATFNANQANPVGIHTDGIYQGSNVAYGFGLFDLDRIEVLKGPQGTLFGRNTTGGVINFIAHKPDVREGANGNASVTYGRFNEADVEGAAGFAMGEHVAARIAGTYLSRDGYVTNRNPAVSMPKEGALDVWALRGQVRLQDYDGFDLVLSAHGGRNHSDIPPGKQIGVICPAGTAFATVGACTDFFGFRDSTNPRENFTNVPSYDHVDTWGGSATATWSLAHVDIVSQTAFEANRRALANDSDQGPVAAVKTTVASRYHQFSEELRVQSSGTALLTWLVGGNFYSDYLHADQAFTLNAFGPGGISHATPVEEGISSSLVQKTRSFAAFGEASYRLTSRLSVTAGARWTSDRRTAATDAFIFNATGLSLAFVDGPAARARLLFPTIPAMTLQRTWGRWSGRGMVSYLLADDLMAYGEISHGFKGGDFNGGALFAPAEATIANPEYVTAYEVGVKGSGWERRVTYDASAFFYDFTNQQVAVVVPGSNSTLQSLANAAKTHVKGLEAEITATPVARLLLQAKAGYLDSHFVRFQLDASNPATNYNGNRTASSPKFTFAGLARYDVPVGADTLSFQLDTSYTGAHFFSVDNNPSLRQGGYWLLNGRISFEIPHASVALWVKNIGDRVYYVSGLGNAGLGFLEVIPGLPRTFGVTLSGRF
jgi:iron complex outermembrane receptor protein